MKKFKKKDIFQLVNDLKLKNFPIKYYSQKQINIVKLMDIYENIYIIHYNFNKYYVYMKYNNYIHIIDILSNYGTYFEYLYKKINNSYVKILFNNSMIINKHYFTINYETRILIENKKIKKIIKVQNVCNIKNVFNF